MSDTLHSTAQIIDFARGVREHLADLPSDEVEDLTEGLEADLAEAFAEDLARELPDPAEYALELRTAAGLPPQASAGKEGIRHAAKGVVDSIRLTASRLRTTPATAGVIEFLVSLRPFWWVARAVVAYMFCVWMTGVARQLVPHTAVQWAVLAAFVVISVQWGRGRWRARWMHWPLLVANAFAVLVLIPVVSHQAEQSLTWQEAAAVFGVNDGGPVNAAAEPMAGVQLNGKDVTNIFAYGADGKLLDGIQLFDQDGHPLATSVPGGNGCLEGTPCVDQSGTDGAGVWVPSVLETGAKAWNVFPMRMQAAEHDDQSGGLRADPAATPQRRTPPFVKVPALMTAGQDAATVSSEKVSGKSPQSGTKNP